MMSTKLTSDHLTARMSAMKRGTGIVLGSVMVPVILAGCINVNAPQDAIVIELNINIRQEVIYRIAEDVESNIEENAGIF